MKKIFFLLLLLNLGLAKSQTLPYSGTVALCLDNSKTISGSTLTPRNLVVRDFNNDGFSDVIVADTASGKIDIFTYAGGLPSITNILPSSTMGFFTSMDAGDIDNDGKIDLVFNDKSGSVFLCKNTSNIGGTFSFSVSGTFTLPLAFYKANPAFLKVRDLNNDLFADIIIALPKISGAGLGIIAYSTNSLIPYIFSVPDYSVQTFTLAPAMSALNREMDMSFGDFNNDNKRDVFITYKSMQGQIAFLQNIGSNGAALSFSYIPKSPSFGSYTLTFGACQMYNFDSNPGDDPIMLVSAYDGSVYANLMALVSSSVISSTPNSPTLVNLPALFNSPITSPIGLNPPTQSNFPRDLVLADVNNDGNKDLVAMSDAKLWVAFWDPFATPLPGFMNNVLTISLPPNIKSDNIAIGDYDKNFLPDIFYKPWGVVGPGVTAVIPNFSYKFHAVGIDTSICPGKIATASLNITPTSSAMPSFSVNWYAAASPSNIILTAPQLSATNTGVYFPALKVISPFSGNEICSFRNKDSIHVISNPIPTVNVVNSTPSVCPGSNITLTATAAGITNTLPPRYTWGGNGFNFVGPILTQSVVGQDFYFVTVRDSGTKCTSIPLQINVDVYKDTSNIKSPKLLICVGDSVQLTFPATQAHTWSYYEYQGAPAPTFISTNTAIYVKPLKGTTYQIDYTDLNSCVSGKQIAINVDQTCAIVIYKGITPNGDNTNDVFTIDNINRYPKNKLEIFNRWGTSIYYTEAYDNVKNYWPQKDSNIPSSTYYYILDLGDGTAKIKGWIELLSN